MASLFESLTIRSVRLKNRIIVSPMCQYSSTDGFINDWHLVHLGSRAVGGAAAVMTEATAVSPGGRISPGDLGIWKDEHIEGLKRVTDFIAAHDAIPGIQLAHAGRKASHQVPWKGGEALTKEEGAWPTIAPSAIAFKEGEPAPGEMSIEEIRDCVVQFRTAAERALRAGFKIIEIHGAHGYLINEFLSPASNKRKDTYGGSFENRSRFLVDIVESIRQVWPQEYPLIVRISATDWTSDGWNGDDSVMLGKLLETKGVDLLDCSTGGNISGVRIELKPMYQVPFAERIKKETSLLSGAVGLITTAAECEQIIAQGKADVVFLARQLLRDPYFPLHAAKELGVDVPWPEQYQRAKK
ncbi:NADH:flavin oxidoreductase/NADH oxidase [Flavisolibacter ginsengisoli]|jgi:2,4-dienoyl-CoA reductase-like NADH-dependent reductase (Old Yellow Enzyme family)|uniref:2,4-dienoyl-CoA reductase n=1 Tax=Flavisolibacter ginsengisoli DSM 18119 TaxID=1121884 RepID=A0A1M4VBM3_9BACT|nr:NADH:flavin oxidoreductase/NADH oxidase [Flavisolibacter ginsengisoli]SHE66375.1 2,4-dienoyl-CoA reductase [Flavisolibacter ginsengisoli DSM 18119]